MTQTQERQPPPAAPPPLAVTILKQYETASTIAAMNETADLIQRLEEELADDKDVLAKGQRTMETLRFDKSRDEAITAGKNEQERRALLEAALSGDALYTRAREEADAAQTRIGYKNAGVENAKRRFTALRLEAEARISSKNLLAGMV